MITAGARNWSWTNTGGEREEAISKKVNASQRPLKSKSFSVPFVVSTFFHVSSPPRTPSTDLGVV